MRPPVDVGVHRAPRCEPVVSLVRSRRAPPVPLIVLPKSCSCRWGPCPPPLSLVWVVCLLSFLGRDGRTVHRHHTGIFEGEGSVVLAVAHPWGVCLFLSLFAVCRRFSLPPLCRPAVFLPSSFSLLSLLPLSRRSPLPRSAAPPPPVAHQKERKKTDNPKEGWEDGTRGAP